MGGAVIESGKFDWVKSGNIRPWLRQTPLITVCHLLKPLGILVFHENPLCGLA